MSKFRTVFIMRPILAHKKQMQLLVIVNIMANKIRPFIMHVKMRPFTTHIMLK